ncbi:MAG: Trk system potassium transporter TrkA [Akkermansiaceae bacterium]|nr:Trk system potassium transporter TrkA [Akkermansiaceae bacterium]
MNIIIVGAGEIGRHLASVFSQQGHTISIIDKEESLAWELEQALDVKVIHGNGSSVEDLANADVGQCDLFLSLTSSNTANMVSASMAKAMQVQKAICRVRPKLQREEWLFDYKGHFDIDHTFSSERLAAIELAKYVRNPESLVVEELARGRIELQQVRIAANSGAIGTPLRKLGSPRGVRLAMISRDGQHFVPDADSELQEGDVAMIFGNPNKLRDFSAELQGKQKRGERLKVVIFGGNEYGFALAQMLESIECDLRIFEKDRELCDQLADRLLNTAIICADATVVANLEEEQVGQADFFIATSAGDEDNVMSCLQAHTLGVENCLTLIHRSDYASAISSSGHHLGIKAAVSPREATRREIQRFITTDRYHILEEFDEALLLEIRVPDKSPVGDLPIQEVKWPQGVVLVGQLRGLHAEVPGPEDHLEPGDHLYAVVARSSLKAFAKLVAG